MHALRPVLATLFALLFACVLAVGLVGCGDEEDDGCPAAGASVPGIQGIVMTPNCNYPVSSATVTARHGSGASLTATTAPNGEFSFAAGQLAEGRWQLSVTKGAFIGESIQETTVTGTNSKYVVLKLGN